MRTIYKYPIEIADTFNLNMPAAAVPLYVAVQDGKPYVWVRVNTDEPMECYTFHLQGTGHPMTGDTNSYVGSFQLPGLVFHLFTHWVG